MFIVFWTRHSAALGNALLLHIVQDQQQVQRAGVILLGEKIRQLSMEAGKNVKEEGKENNLLELIAADPAFNLTLEELERSMDPAKYVGRAPLQVTKFLENVVHPALAERKELLGVEVEITV